MQAIGLVTDVGFFLERLESELASLGALPSPGAGLNQERVARGASAEAMGGFRGELTSSWLIGEFPP